MHTHATIIIEYTLPDGTIAERHIIERQTDGTVRRRVETPPPDPRSPQSERTNTKGDEPI